MELKTRQVVGIYFCRHCHRQLPMYEGSERRRHCDDCLPIIASESGKRGGRGNKKAKKSQ